jgi:DNA-binding response OmpR family regulator
MSAAPRRVLVVDDEADVRFTIKSTLSPEFEIVEACDGEQAERLAAEINPAVIFLDAVMLPGKGGLDVLPRLKQLVPSARIVMLTGERDLTLAAQALARGASAYVTKPFDVDQLRAEARGHTKTSDAEGKPWRVV